MDSNIVVLVKHIYDENQLKVDPSTGSVNFLGVPGKVSTFDRNAMEAALRLKAKLGGTITTLTVGRSDSAKSIREVAAMGADGSVLVQVEPGQDPDAGEVARSIVGALKTLGPWSMLICAEGSADTYTSVIPAMVSQILNVPFLSYLNRLEVDGQAISGDRLLEREVVKVKANLPAVVSVVSEINEPRIPTLLQIMGAMKREIKTMPYEAKQDSSPRFSVTKMYGKTKDRKGIVFEGSSQEVTDRLFDAMVKEGVV